MNASFRIKAMLGVMMVSLLYLAYSSFTSTPSYSLRKIQEAYERHDAVSFQKYVDVERVAANVYDQIMKAAPDESRDYSWETVDEPTGVLLVAFMKSRVVKEAKNQVVDFILTGRFDEEEAQKSGGLDFSLPVAWREYCGNQTAFAGIDYIRKEGSVAHAGLKLCRDNGTTFTFDLVMERQGGHWQVTEISNFSEYLSRDFEMEANRLAKRDMLIAEAMQETLVLGNLKKSTTPGGLGIGENVIFELELTNQGIDEIDEYAVEIICKSLDGEELGRYVIDSMEDLKPGETDTGSLFKYVNMHVRGDRILYDLPQSGLDITARIQYIKFSEKSTMRLAALY